MEVLNRRKALKRLGIAGGGVILAPMVASFLSGCTTDPAGYVYHTLTDDDLDTLVPLVDVILPSTDTPGASEAGVPAFIDDALSRWDENTVDALRRGMAGIETAAQDRHQARFSALTSEQQEDVVQTFADAQGALFDDLKWATVLGYLTSEAGSTSLHRQEMAFERFEGTVPYAEVGAAWSIDNL